jgi:hypothetical protein
MTATVSTLRESTPAQRRQDATEHALDHGSGRIRDRRSGKHQGPHRGATVWPGAAARVICHGWHVHYIVLAQFDQEQRERFERVLETKVRRPTAEEVVAASPAAIRARFDAIRAARSAEHSIGAQAPIKAPTAPAPSIKLFRKYRRTLEGVCRFAEDFD